MKKQKLSNLSLSKKTISNLTASNLSGGETTGLPCLYSTGTATSCDTTPLSHSDALVTCSWCPDGNGGNDCQKEQLVG